MAANGMLFLQRGRVVVTDRLHGHILSLLCGIPHVVIDPVNHKITSYMKSWTGGIENILVADSSEDALNKAIELIQKLACCCFLRKLIGSSFDEFWQCSVSFKVLTLTEPLMTYAVCSVVYRNGFDASPTNIVDSDQTAPVGAV